MDSMVDLFQLPQVPITTAMAVLAACSSCLLGLLFLRRFSRLRQSGTFPSFAATPMCRVELLFGTKRKGQPAITEDEWQSFVDTEVTPRFPDGLTVLTGYGQFRNRSGLIARDHIKLLLIWYQRSTTAEQSIEAIRVAYVDQFGLESVLRADSSSHISF
jgi:hypothetical protein